MTSSRFRCDSMLFGDEDMKYATIMFLSQKFDFGSTDCKLVVEKSTGGE